MLINLLIFTFQLLTNNNNNNFVFINKITSDMFGIVSIDLFIEKKEDNIVRNSYLFGFKLLWIVG